MIRLLITGLAAGIFVGCSSEESASSKTPSSQSSPASENSAEELLENASMTVAGLDLYMHSDKFTVHDTAKPTFWVHASKGELTGDESLWTLTDTQAVIYRDEEDDMRMQAKRGWFDQIKNTAQLSGGVTIESGTMKISTDEVNWDNEHGTVTSSSTTELQRGPTHITATSFTMIPKTGGIRLSRPQGTIYIGDL